MKSLHICYISQEYPPETGWGGIGSYTYEMAHALAGAGHRVTVISRALEAESVITRDGVEVHRVAPSPAWDAFPALWRINRIWAGFAWAAMRKIRKLHREHPIDIVEAAEGRADSFFSGLIPGGPKALVRLHTARVFVDRINKVPALAAGRREYWLEKKAIAHASIVTAPSRAVIELTKTWIPLTNALVIPNPVDTEKFSPGTSTRTPTVLYVGRLERNKGVETIASLIPAVLRQFPSAQFRFVGTDGMDENGVSWRERLSAAAAPHHQAQLRFEQLSREELPDAYRQAAVCILPSTWENCPYALLEAMACGTPVVASNSGGIPEIVEHGVSGFLEQTGDAAAFATRIVSLLEDEEWRATIGDRARSRIEETFSVARVAPKMMAVYEGTIQRQKRHAVRPEEMALPSRPQ